VDFHYEVNGKMYQFSLPGGEKIALSDLIEVLGIIGDANNGEKAAFNSVDQFLKEVANVEFSDESLVKVAKNEEGNDWILESLASFDTEESLTITMKNGDVVTVKVTDAQPSEGNLGAIGNSDDVVVSVNKAWESPTGDAVTENLPERATFRLKREMTYGISTGEPATEYTLILKDNGTEFGQYSFQYGTTATIYYVYNNNFAMYGGNPSYTIDGGSSVSLPTNSGTGSFTVVIPASGQIVVDFSEGWGGNQLHKDETETYAVGEELIDMEYHTDQDTEFNASAPSLILTEASGWSGSFTPYPATEIKDNITYNYKYYIEEDPVDGWKTDISNNVGLDVSGTVTVTNTSTADRSITVSKSWADAGGSTIYWPDDIGSVRVKIQRRIGLNEFSDIDDIEPQNIYPEENTEKGQHTEVVFGDLPAVDESTGEFYEYRVVEVDPPAGYETQVINTGDAYTVVNKEAAVDVPVEKNWDDFSGSDCDWSATLRLQWAPIYEGDTSASSSFKDVRPIQEITITKEMMEEGTGSLGRRTFTRLPKYGKDENGVYRIQYSLEEMSYEASDGEGTYTYNTASGYNTTDEDKQYEAFYPHDAGEESPDDDDYYIVVNNHKRNTTNKQYIDIDLNKIWADHQDDDNAWAEFQLMRYKRTEYRDISRASDEDLATPVMVTLQGSNGVRISEIEIPRNTSFHVAATFLPHTEEKSVNIRVSQEGEVDQNITLTSSAGNAGNEIVRSLVFYPMNNITVTILDGEENLDGGSYGVQLLNTLGQATEAVPDTSYQGDVIRLSKENGWENRITVLQQETSCML